MATEAKVEVEAEAELEASAIEDDNDMAFLPVDLELRDKKLDQL